MVIKRLQLIQNIDLISKKKSTNSNITYGINTGSFDLLKKLLPNISLDGSLNGQFEDSADIRITIEDKISSVLECFAEPEDISSIWLSNQLCDGEIFVGSLKSSKEIEFILEEMKLSNHPTVRGALIDHTQDEGVIEEKKYNFLMQDYNNRKCLTKNKIPRCFAETFRTLKDEDDFKGQLDTNDKIVPVTGTIKLNEDLYDD